VWVHEELRDTVRQARNLAYIEKRKARRSGDVRLLAASEECLTLALQLCDAADRLERVAEAEPART
jgi:hypothetical protein